jgi:cysteinyl-tRNA synthetase
MSALQLYNTLTRRVETFVSLRPGEVRMYVCGLTPSAQAHLGHARSFLFFDVLRRYLEHPRNEYRVTYVQNVTDIDDRSIATAQAEHADVMDVVARYYGEFKAAMRVLGVREPDVEPHATQHIDGIVTMIGELLASGHAYAVDDGVYYAVKSFPRYGALSHRNVDELLVGARIAENEHKRDPLDFALWKIAKPGEPFWPAPWGAGRPGWHIECSAMSRELLGVPFDIHGGGFDLVFPHHENEMAQSEALMPDGQRLARYWMHGGLLNFDGRKMSKSLGNFEPLSDVLERHHPLAIRLLFLQTGYRKPMNFTEDAIAGATAGLERLRKAYDALDAACGGVGLDDEATVEDVERTADRFFAALDDDMNTAGALGVLFDAAGAAHRVAADNDRDAAGALRTFFVDALGVLGLAAALEREPAGVVPARTVDSATAERIERMIDERNAARKARDFARADVLRNTLAAEGIVLTDGKDRTTWTVDGG